MKTFNEISILEIIKQNGFYICNIENPTEEEIVESIKQNPSVIQYIDIRNYLLKDSISNCVEEDITTTEGLKRRIKKLMVKIITENPLVLRYINIKEYLFKNLVYDDNIIIYNEEAEQIETLCNEILIESIKQNRFIFSYIENPTDEMKLIEKEFNKELFQLLMLAKQYEQQSTDYNQDSQIKTITISELDAYMNKYMTDKKISKSKCDNTLQYQLQA